MPGESVFRSAAPAPTSASMAPIASRASADPHAPTETHNDTLLYTYEGDHLRPYSAEYFGAGDTWDAEPSLARDLREIEGYLREQVHRGHLENDVKAAANLLKEMERKAELTRYESVPQRIQKLLGYIDFRRTVDG